MNEEEDEMPFVFKLTAPLAKWRISALGFDRRRRDTKIFEYAIHRYYMDIIEILVAISIIITRIYLAIDIGQPYSGSIPLNSSDFIVFALTIGTFLKNWTLIKDYRKNVIGRIDAVAKNK